MKLLMLMLTCVAALISAPAVADPSYTLSKDPPYRYEFRLEKGAGTPVCDAYLKRLRNTDFHRLPQCERPENTSVPGFKALDRVPLTQAEVLKLYEPVAGWLLMDDLDYYNKLRANKAKLGEAYVFPNDAAAAAKAQAARVQRGAPLYFRVNPVDIDNDGTLDNVVVWKKEDFACGNQRSSEIFPAVVDTYLVALSDHGELDVDQTRELLEWHEQSLTDAQRTRGPIYKIADTFGIFSFDGQYYTDAFYLSDDNLDEQSRAGKPVSAVLGVFHRKKGIGAVACQIRWYDRPQK